jgi:hypothetical protein
MENYLRQYPSGTHASAARAKIQELQWQAVDKTDPEALRAFAGRYPDGPLAAEAKQQVEAVLVARESKAEDNDWSAIDHGSPAALEGFLKRHPGGQHAAAASTTLTDVERKARIGETQRTEEAAWRRVNRRDEASLESFIRESPRSPHRNEAEVELGAIRLRHASANETAAVLTVISRFADAWKAKDLDSILAIQKNLSKRAVRAELSHVMKLDMQISPASPPQIDGEQAVVLCRRQASQIYSDGTRKLIPESIVSYVLAKHDGNWTIEGTR